MTDPLRVNTFDLMMRHEAGEATSDETLILFGELVRTGQAWTLQGHYGREAQTLIDAGYLERTTGRIDWDRAHGERGSDGF